MDTNNNKIINLSQERDSRDNEAVSYEKETEQKKEQIKEVVDYVIDNASQEALIDFSKQFLAKHLSEDMNEFERYWKLYKDHTTKSIPGFGQLTNFPSSINSKEN